MVGNMIELNKPTAIMDHMARDPLPKLAIRISAIEHAALKASALPGLM